VAIDWNCVGALAACLAAFFAYLAVKVAERGVTAALKGVDATVSTVAEAKKAVLEARAARRAELFLQLSGEYASEKMHQNLVLLSTRMRASASIQKMVDDYVSEVSTALDAGELAEWDKARRKVSRFFLRAADLAQAGLLDREVLARLVRKSGMKLYANTVRHLEKAHNERVLHSDDYDHALEGFWMRFGEEQFGPSFWELPSPDATSDPTRTAP
jgi:hypothetical protein